jgi:hypothetical protein
MIRLILGLKGLCGFFFRLPSSWSSFNPTNHGSDKKIFTNIGFVI